MSTESKPARLGLSPKPKISTKVIQAIAIKPSPVPEKDEEDNTAFKLCYVSTQGKQLVHLCSKAVFQAIENQRLTFDHKNNFRLRLGTDDTVTSLDKYPKPELNSVFKTSGEEGEDKGLVFQRHKDKSFTLKAQPSDVATAVVDEVLSLLHEHPEVDDGDYLDGRYIVTGITKKGGAEMIYVNPQAK